jgi:asparagine synthase (glutamine-hydrolysing)
MCGIVGILRPDCSAIHRSDELASRVEAMSRAIVHRGPNSTGAISTTFCEARFRRLSIIDLMLGDQPLWNERRDVAVFFNGEIYNHAELRRDLERRGHRLDSGSDGAVIPHLYEDSGSNFADALNGMYAILVVDLARRRVLLCRDPVGIKPLYFADVGGLTVFGSELKAVLASGLVDREIDDAAWEEVPAFLSSPGPKTAIRGVEELEPGVTLTVDCDGRRHFHTRRADAGTNPSIADEPTALGALRGGIDAAVARQIVADVPVGLALSGGVDSILVASSIPRELRPRLLAVTVDFQNDSDALDIEYARTAARHLGIRHAIDRVDPMLAIESLPSLVWNLDIPNADPAALSMQIVARSAARHVTVLLSGTGGDELFGGYGHFQLSRRRRLLRRIPPFLRPFLASRRGVDPMSEALSRAAVAQWGRDRSHATLAARFVHPPVADWSRAVERYRTSTDSAWAEVGSLDLVNRHLFTDFRTYLGGQTLPLLDRITMSEHIEGRVPLLDLELLGVAFSIDGSLKLREGQPSKRLLRRIVAERMPSELANMPKRGFTNPIERAMRGPLAAAVRLVASDRDGILRRLGHGKLLDGIAQGRVDLERNWLFGYSVLVCALWERMHLRDGASRRPECGLFEYIGLDARRRAG